MARHMYNVFEDVVPPRRAGAIAEIKSELIARGALGATMSGTGPTVFGLFDHRQTAQRACNVLREHYRDTFLCRPV